jgi:hypothetical protein
MGGVPPRRFITQMRFALAAFRELACRWRRIGRSTKAGRANDSREHHSEPQPKAQDTPIAPGGQVLQSIKFPLRFGNGKTGQVLFSLPEQPRRWS